MPAKKKKGALPREGVQKKTPTTNKHPPQSSQQRSQSGGRRSERNRLRNLNEELPAKEQSVLEPGITNSKGSEDRSIGASKPAQNDGNDKFHLYTKLSAWLEEVRANADATAGAFDSNDSSLDDSDTETSVLSSVVVGEGPSMLGVSKKAKAKKPTGSFLEARQIRFNAPRADDLTARFRTFLVEEPIKIPFGDTLGLQKSIKLFLEKADKAERGEDAYDAIEALREDISEWTASMRLAAVTNREFTNDLERCKSRNEAVFQRTVIMSILSRSQLKPIFDFNFEGHWPLRGSNALPSTLNQNDPTTCPRPDLAIFFRYDSLVRAGLRRLRLLVPDGLKFCMSPDKYRERCFPFIFIEGESGCVDITAAAEANMHSASQALFNIYMWMESAKQQDIFFKEVRVFSFALNAQQVIARVHRAAPCDEEGESGLEFYYDELNPASQFNYTRDQICTLIHNILIDYAESKLFGILKAATEKVLEEYSPKRKGDDMILEPSSKRLTSAPVGSQQAEDPLMDPQTSFGFSRVGITDH